MTNLEKTETALKLIAQKYVDDCINKLSELPKEAKTERKALSIVKNEAQLCVCFVEISFNSPRFSERYFTMRERRVFSFRGFEGMREWYDSATTEDKQMFLIYAHAIGHVLHAVYKGEKYEAAKQSGDVEKEFEYGLINNILDSITGEWRKWWAENGCVRCEV